MLSLCRVPHQTVLLSTQCLQGLASWKAFLTLWSWSPQCARCTECSNPNTGHNAEGMEVPSGLVRTEFIPQHPKVREEALTEYMEVSSLSFCL